MPAKACLVFLELELLPFPRKHFPQTPLTYVIRFSGLHRSTTSDTSDTSACTVSQKPGIFYFVQVHEPVFHNFGDFDYWILDIG